MVYILKYICFYIYWKNNVPNLAFGTRYLPSGSVESLPYVGLIGKIIIANVSNHRDVEERRKAMI